MFLWFIFVVTIAPYFLDVLCTPFFPVWEINTKTFRWQRYKTGDAASSRAIHIGHACIKQNYTQGVSVQSDECASFFFLINHSICVRECNWQEDSVEKVPPKIYLKSDRDNAMCVANTLTWREVGLRVCSPYFLFLFIFFALATIATIMYAPLKSSNI